MKTIKTDNFKDFIDQYHKINHKETLFERNINIETSDNFWKELIEKPVRASVQSINIFKDEKNDIDIDKVIFGKVYHPEYGNLIRVLKHIK